jgi:hypothetical protein
MPDKSTVLRWLLDVENKKFDSFRDQYTRAREVQRHGYEDECIDIADDGSNDWMEKEVRDGRVVIVFNQESYQRSRLRIDARERAIERMASKRPGAGKAEVKVSFTRGPTRKSKQEGGDATE